MPSLSTPRARKWIKLAQEMGLPVTGFEVLADGGFRVLTALEKQDQAEVALDQWIKSENG